MWFRNTIPKLFFAVVAVGAASALGSSLGNVTTSDGIHLRYVQAGPAAGQKLLLVHGWRQTAAQWRKQIDYFSGAGYRVTAYDMRGHGDSGKSDFGYSLSRFGSDLNDVLNTLDLTNVSIVAHSLHGLLSLLGLVGPVSRATLSHP